MTKLSYEMEHRMPGVEEFTAALARSMRDGIDDCFSGHPGRRVVLLVDRLARMHLPGTVGRCPDCRLSPDGRPCMTWRVLAETLTGLAEHRVDTEFERLLCRYADAPAPLGS
jgi:hypothetical protein